MYDNDSESLGDIRSPLHVLSRAIYETSFRKFLKNIPMVLVGGIQAWKRTYGDPELARPGSSSPGRPGLLANLVNGASSPGIDSVPGTPTSEPKGLGLGHLRAPAESSVLAPSPAAPVPTAEFATISLGRARSGTEPTVDPYAHRPWIPSQSSVRSPVDPGSPRLGMDGVGSLPSLESRRVQRPGMSRTGSNSVSYSSTPGIPENVRLLTVFTSTQ